MNATEQEEFVSDLLESVKEKIVAEIASGKIPQDWNGIDLRWLVSEKSAFGGSGKRKREFNNFVLINNL